jgi:hypothetical protein
MNQLPSFGGYRAPPRRSSHQLNSVPARQRRHVVIKLRNRLISAEFTGLANFSSLSLLSCLILARHESLTRLQHKLGDQVRLCPMITTRHVKSPGHTKQFRACHKSLAYHAHRPRDHLSKGVGVARKCLHAGLTVLGGSVCLFPQIVISSDPAATSAKHKPPVTARYTLLQHAGERAARQSDELNSDWQSAVKYSKGARAS